MNAQNIISWINNPASINEEATQQLKTVVENYPYSSVLQWLYLKGLQNQESYLYTSQLNRAAIGSTKRAALKNWVEIPVAPKEEEKRFVFSIPKDKETEKPVVTPTPTVEVTPPVQPKVVTLPKVEPINPVQPIETKPAAPQPLKPAAQQDLPDDIKAILERSKRLRSNFSKNTLSASAEEKDDASTEPTTFVVETTSPIIPVTQAPTAENTSVTKPTEIPEIETPFVAPEPLPEVAPPPVQEVPEEPKEEPVFIESFELDTTILEEAETDWPDQEQQEEGEQYIHFNVEIEEEITTKVKYSFSEWLHVKKGDKPAPKEQSYNFTSDEIEPHTTQPKLAQPYVKIVLDDDEDANYFELPETDGSSAENPESGKKKTIALVDKFLETKPKIRPNPNGPQIENGLESSVIDSSEFITQTLADIYIKQGHLEKALEAYEILRLKYPKKSGFFADRIREIKSLKK